MIATRTEIDNLTFDIIGAAIEVHKELGPGLLESIYQGCLCIELKSRGICFESELEIPIVYKKRMLDANLRADLLVEGVIVVELKSVEKMLPVFDAQLLTYMKLLCAPKGILINFNCTNIVREGQRTFVNEFFTTLK
ncbi:MAG: GxxExxY protein [Bacteroidota bacterium]|jgi:GxxExxY protein